MNRTAVLRQDGGPFLGKYEGSLSALASAIRETKPSFIIAMTRKAPRLLELLDLWGIDYGRARVITEKSLQFMSSSELKGQGVVIFDDIVNVGSTLNRLFRQHRGLAGAPVFCLAYNDVWFAEKLVPQIRPQMQLSQQASSVFCHEVVQNLAFLDKPYDLDHPIFYSSIAPSTLSELLSRQVPDTAYEISSSFQRSIAKRRFSFFPNPDLVEQLMAGLFEDPEAVQQQICKMRLYYDEQTQRANLVPMLICEVREGRWAFSHAFEEFNQLIRQVVPVNLKDRNEAVHRLMSYLSSYLTGMAFCIRDSTDAFPEVAHSRPSAFLNLRDLHYLFGARCSKQIVGALDALRPRTLEALAAVCAPTVMLHQPKPETSEAPSSLDATANRLVKRIAPYLRRNVRKTDYVVDQLACVFEALFYAIEIPTRKRILRKNNLRGESRRLQYGFTYEQIRQILARFGEFDLQDRASDLRLSLALDYLVDAGVIVPFYSLTEGTFRRYYRYGEDGLCQRKVGFLLDGVLHSLSGLHGEAGLTVMPKIPLEKTLVLIQRKLNKSPEDVAALQPDAGWTETVKLQMGYCVHGAIATAEYLDEQGLSHTEWVTGWCKNQGLLVEAEQGYEYSEDFRRQHPEDLSMVPKSTVSKYSILAAVLDHIDAAIDPSDDSSYLVCLSTCFSAESTMRAMAKELYYLFHSQSRDLEDERGAALGWLLERSLQKELPERLRDGAVPKDLLDKCRRRILNADKAANELRNKLRLYRRRAEIVNSIKTSFGALEPGNQYKLYFESQLEDLLERMVEDPTQELRPGIDEHIHRLDEVGSLCIRISALLKLLLSVSKSIASGPKTQTGRLFVHTSSKVAREMSRIAENVSQINADIQASQSTFSGQSISDLPLLTLPSLGSGVPSPIELADFLGDLVSGLWEQWSSIGTIYTENYAPAPFERSMRQLFPADTRVSPFRWAIWYDVKDSRGTRNKENEVNAPLFKERVGDELKKAVRALSDAKFTPGDNDEKFIHAAKETSIPHLLQTVLAAADSIGVFVRAGIAGIDDTGSSFMRVSGTDLLQSERSFALPKRLGESIKGDAKVRLLKQHSAVNKLVEPETDDAHTVVLSNEAYRKIWKTLSPVGTPVRVEYPIDEPREYTFYVWAKVPAFSRFLPGRAPDDL